MTTRQINFRCPVEIATLFEAAARRADLSLTQWLIQTGLIAAGRTEILKQLQRVARHRPKKTKRR